MTPSTVPLTAPEIPEIYEGQFGNFSITDHDRREVILYRSGLVVAAVSFAAGVALVLGIGTSAIILQSLSLLYGLFWIGLGVSLWNIHIYLRVLHRALQAFWVIGGLASLGIAGYYYPDPFVSAVYQHPLTIFGVGFTFAAFTGIFFKEAFCFNRFETKFLTPLVPLLLLGHLTGILPATLEQNLLVAWAVLMGVFAFRKAIQPIPPDIGDKSVFEYLKQERLKNKASASY